MSFITWKEKSVSSEQWRILLLSASYGAAFPSLAAPLVAASAVDFHFSEEIPVNATPTQPRRTLFRYVADLWAQYQAYRRLTQLLGKELDIPFYRSEDILAEAQRHKWLEAEKAGRDIWCERDPYDPEGCALRDWVSRYLDSWKRSNLRIQH
ncbi:MAG: hypothetical protein SFY68_00910 [Candidatus Sumerlaeia bacterium]|nr:hypothetical protein [Candidatus Sumerlaeia bacterium]